jgi:hypothetical protein
MDPATSNTNVFPSRLAPVVGGGIVDGGDDPAGFNIYNNSQIAGVCPANLFSLLL